jgi:predicted GNAT family acetyltransferase
MSSITDNPEQFFNELSNTKEEKPSPAIVPEPPSPAQAAAKETSITENPSAFFDNLSKPVEPYKKETPQSVFLGQVAEKKAPELDTFDIQSLNSLQPEELHDVAMARKDIPLTDQQLRTAYDFHKNKSASDQNYGTPSSLREFMDMTNRWVEPIGEVGNDVAHTLWSAAKGAGKLAYRTADFAFAPDMSFAENRKYYTPEQQAELKRQQDIKRKSLEDAWQSAVDPIIGMPEELAWIGTKLGAGGMDWYDRASEAVGLQDHEKSFQNFKNRRAVESAQAQYYMDHPTALGRTLDLPIVKSGLEAIVKHDMPTTQEWMASHPNLSREQAQAELDAIAKDHVETQLRETESRIAATDPDIATASTFLAPEGIGMGTMGALGMGARVAGELTPKIAQGLKYLGKTDAEINAMQNAAQILQREQKAKAAQDRMQPSLLEKAAGGTAKAIDWTGALAKGITEKIPKQIRPFVPYVAGGAAGGLYGHEQGRSVIGDVLRGIEIAGLMKAPALVRDIEAARRISGGGTKGTFETMGGFPNVSTGAAKILRAGGKNIDNLLSNAAEYAKSGIHATALAVATGALDSASPEEMNDLVSKGLVYGLGGHAFERIKGGITGRDPILEKRKRAQQDVDNLRTFSELSPESQNTLKDVTSWNNVVDNQQQKANDARIAYLDALQRGSKDVPELRNKWQAETNALSTVMRANVQTRNEYGRIFVDQLSRNTNLANGTLKAGQNNVGVHILTPKQIFDKFRQDPANAGKSDADVQEAASQAGFYSSPDGAIEYKSGMGMEAPKKDLVFDRTKPSIVINADHLKARMKIFGESANQALNHEFGHHISNIPEFREANKDAEALLFSQEIKDPSGAVVSTTSGRYSPKDLVDMYENNYMKGKSPEQIQQLSQLAGLWDHSRQALDENAVAAYMKEEILADLNLETLSNHLGKDLDSGTLHLMDLARLKTKKNLLDKAVNKFAGLGGKGDPVSALTGAEFSPEVLAANRQAVRALQSLQGEVSPAVAAPEAPKISRSEMMKNRALQERAKYSGLFKTKVQAQVYDAAGKPVGAPVDIENINASEGSWQNKNGSLRQVTGYGQRPDEAMGVQIPEGGSLVVGRQIVRQADGVTPVLMEPKEAKQLQKDRARVVRDALNTPDAGAPNRFEPTGDPDGTWRGTFTPLQIEAIKNLPEGIVPKSVKEKMLKINDLIVQGDGSRILADYAAMMNDNGRYTPYSAKIYDLVPIGMHLSKDGHFLATTISVGRMFDKLNKWSERMPARLSPWNGSKDAFFKEFTQTYLKNWQNGLAGETGLGGTPAEALAKKNIFNDFLNLTTKDAAPLNPDRTRTPRQRGDVRGKDIDRTIMSVRLDHITELMDNEHAPKVPVSYQKAKFNMMPKPEEGEEAVKPLTFAPKGEQPALTPEILKGITATHIAPKKENGISFMPADEKYPTSERGFYSGLQKTIDEKMPAKASPQQILSIVNNPQNAKADEVKWSNLAGFLEGKTSVTKQEVLDYLRNEGSVKFEEVTLEQPSESEIEALLADEMGEGMDRQDAIDYLSKDDGRTQYDQYVLPSGENYREVVLTIPQGVDALNKFAKLQDQLIRKYEARKPSDLKGKLTPAEEGEYTRLSDLALKEKDTRDIYTSSHFAQIPNYIAHMRLDERQDSSGKDGLFIEEIQSDRHQQGRERGYAGEEKYKSLPEEYTIKSEKKPDKGTDIGNVIRYYVEDANGKQITSKSYSRESAENEAINTLNDQARGTSASAISDAPFRKDWPVQMFKRALRDAIESDKEWIGWTKGEAQAERYDLSKQIDRIDYSVDEDGLYSASAIKGQSEVFSKEGMELSEVEATFGKEISEKMQSNKGKNQENDDGIEFRSLSGLDLKVGGEGMKGFYDNILPKEIGKYVKKWGAKVEEGEVDNRQPEDNAYYEEPKPEHFTPIWKVQITPEMRSSIKEGGQIAFMPSREEEPERIKEATYTNPRTGEVSRGATHLIANPNAPQEATDRESPAYGFETDKGRIVDRNEAYSIAQTAGQLKEPTTPEEKFHADRGVLHSGMYEPKGIAVMPSAGEERPVPTQKELDAMKARLPKYSAKTEKYSGKYGDVIKIYSPDRSREVGFAIIGKSMDRDNTIDVYETNVDLRYRGKGYGEALYREIAKYAQGKDADTLFGGSVTPEAQKVRNKLFKTQPSTTSGFGVESAVPSGISFMPKSEEEPKNLVAVHNTSAEKIENALKIGGFAVPSVAIIRNDRSQFDSFGNITLVATKGLINPEEEKKSKVFNADVYSPRYPSVSYSITDRKAAKSLRDSLVSAIDKMPEDLRKKFFVSFESEQADRPMLKRFSEEPIFMAAFLADTGRIKNVPFSKAEDRFEQQSAKWDVREYINSNPELKDEFNNWLTKTLKDSGVTEEEKLFAGYTPSGTRRYLPHTIENVVKMMTKSIRDGEGFNYGVGSIRSKAAKQFRTMKAIESSRENIISKEEMERLKDEVNNEFENIVEESSKQRANQGREGFVMDAVSDDIKAFAEGGAENMKYLREMYPDGIPTKLWGNYLEKLRGLPTEYFEAKIQRGVDLNEFAGAVVPEGTSQDLINNMEKKGLEVVTYPKGDKTARAESIKRISGKRSDIAFMPEGQKKEAEFIDWTTFTQKIEKPLSTIRAYAFPKQEKDESY